MTSDPDHDLHAYVDGRMAPEARARFEAWLDVNPESARMAAAYREQRTALREAAARLAQQDPPAQTVARFVAMRQRPSVSARAREWLQAAFSINGRGMSWRLQPLAAALLIFLVGGAGGWSLRAWQNGSQPIIRPLVEEAADTYAVFGPDRLHPVEIGADDYGNLLNWVSARLAREVRVPGASGSYRLLGGRVVATSRGPAAMFMYDDGADHRIILMVCPQTLHGTAPLTDSMRKRLAGVSWSERGIGYSLVGETSTGVLHALAESFRRQIEQET